MADISSLKINARLNVERPNQRESLQEKMKIEKKKRRKSFISNGKYESQRNCEWCGRSNGEMIPKFANFWNFDSFANLKKMEIPQFSNLEN